MGVSHAMRPFLIFGHSLIVMKTSQMDKTSANRQHGRSVLITFSYTHREV